MKLRVMLAVLAMLHFSEAYGGTSYPETLVSIGEIAARRMETAAGFLKHVRVYRAPVKDQDGKQYWIYDDRDIIACYRIACIDQIAAPIRFAADEVVNLQRFAAAEAIIINLHSRVGVKKQITPFDKVMKTFEKVKQDRSYLEEDEANTIIVWFVLERLELEEDKAKKVAGKSGATSAEKED